MLVPAAVEELHEAHAALDHAPGQQTVAGEAPVVVAAVQAVQVADGARLARQVGQLGHRRLHAKGHLVLGDAGVDLRIAEGFGGHLVQLAQAVEHAAARVRIDAGRIGQVQDRVARAGAEADPLVLAGQEAGAPQAREDGLIGAVAAALRDHDHEGRQVLVFGAQSVAEPGAEARPARLLAASLDVGDGRIVIDRLGVHGIDDGNVIGDAPGMRQ